MKKPILLLSIIFLFSCNKPIKKEMLTGKYMFNTWSHDIINIYKDGSYNHLSNQGQTLNRSTWSYNGSEILFNNFRFNNTENGGLWISEVGYTNDHHIKLVYADEEGFYYQKIEN